MEIPKELGRVQLYRMDPLYYILYIFSYIYIYVMFHLLTPLDAYSTLLTPLLAYFIFLSRLPA